MAMEDKMHGGGIKNDKFYYKKKQQDGEIDLQYGANLYALKGKDDKSKSMIWGNVTFLLMKCDRVTTQWRRLPIE